MTHLLRICYLKIIPGEFEIVAKTFTEVITDRTSSESSQYQGHGACKRIIARIARGIMWYLIMRFP